MHHAGRNEALPRIPSVWQHKGRTALMTTPSTVTLARAAIIALTFGATTILAMSCPAVAQAQPRQAGAPDVFAALRIGMIVSLAEKPGGLIEIQILNDGKIGAHKVVEVYPGHVVVEDMPGIVRKWIPVSSVQSISWTRAPGATVPR